VSEMYIQLCNFCGVNMVHRGYSAAPVEQVMAESKAREQKEHAEGLDITEQLKDVENTTTEHVIEQTHATSGAHVEGRDQEMEDLGNNHDKMDSSPGSTSLCDAQLFD
jgi:hypothetical protein